MEELLEEVKKIYPDVSIIGDTVFATKSLFIKRDINRNYYQLIREVKIEISTQGNEAYSFTQGFMTFNITPKVEGYERIIEVLKAIKACESGGWYE